MVGGIYGYSLGYGSFVYNNIPVGRIDRDEISDAKIRAMKRSGQIECTTCENRKYQDGSNEMVSFKSPGHISPASSGSIVRSHEQEHVANAYSKAGTDNGQVLQASVSLKTAVCPECGRSYVSGGTNTTQIKYSEDNPYSREQKEADASILRGMNFDVAV